LKKWFCSEMVWKPDGREKVCDDKNFKEFNLEKV
jgi:hypothetical protein